MISLKQEVKYAVPFAGEEALRFIVVELNGDRCRIEAICDMPIRPQTVVLVADLVAA